MLPAQDRCKIVPAIESNLSVATQLTATSADASPNGGARGEPRRNHDVIDRPNMRPEGRLRRRRSRL
jgi:hypothetical protein